MTLVVVVLNLVSSLRKRAKNITLPTFLKVLCMSLLWKACGWKTIDYETEEVRLSHGTTILRLRVAYALLLITEWNEWERYYLPSFSLSGKTVLDAGSGCGETAYFYLMHGAKKIIAVENCPAALEFLKENAERNRWPVEIVPESFSATLLGKHKFDFMKVDVDGPETELLKLDALPCACVVEVHTRSCMEQLRSKFGMKIVETPHKQVAYILTGS